MRREEGGNLTHHEAKRPKCNQEKNSLIISKTFPRLLSMSSILNTPFNFHLI